MVQRKLMILYQLMKSKQFKRILSAFAFCSVLGPAFSGAGDPEIAARVNGETITADEFRRALNRAQPDSVATRNDVARRRSLVLEALIDEKLFKQFLNKNVSRPEGAVVENRINELKSALTAQNRSWQDYLLDSGQTDESIRSDIRAVIQWNAYINKFVTDKALKEYFYRNRDFLSGEQIRISHIVIPFNAQSGSAARDELQSRLLSIRKEINDGLSFAAAAEKYSVNSSPESPPGGDIGHITAHRASEDAFIRTASALEPGQISDVVHSRTAAHLIMVTDRRPGRAVKFDDIKQDIQLLWADELRSRIGRDLRKEGEIKKLLP